MRSHSAQLVPLSPDAGLPPEIWLLIITMLSYKEWVKLAQVNHFFYKIVGTPSLWRRYGLTRLNSTLSYMILAHKQYMEPCIPGGFFNELSLIDRYPILFCAASDRLKGDRETIEAVVRRCPQAFKHVPESLAADRDFILSLARKNIFILSYISNTLREDRAFNIAVVAANRDWVKEEIRAVLR